MPPPVPGERTGAEATAGTNRCPAALKGACTCSCIPPPHTKKGSMHVLRTPSVVFLVSPTRIELVAYSLGGYRSIQLSYEDTVGEHTVCTSFLSSFSGCKLRHSQRSAKRETHKEQLRFPKKYEILASNPFLASINGCHHAHKLRRMEYQPW